MESNRDEAFRCIELSISCIKKKDLDKAWKFSVKAHKLFPSSKTKSLMKKLKSSIKNSKQRSKKHDQTVSSDSSKSDDDDDKSGSSTNNSATFTHQPTKKHKSTESSTTYSIKMFKDINKDESNKCLEIAEKHIQNKQYEEAEKFVLKSKKLFFFPKADDLLKSILELKEINKPTYTNEQENFVKKVKNSENYYTMLGVKSTASVSEIKKAYKKLALLLHPDKNSAPGSGEVFIAVNNAADTLCDITKRNAYDQTLRKPLNSNYSAYYRPSQHYCRQHSSHASFGTHRNFHNFYHRYSPYEDLSDGGYVHYDDEGDIDSDDDDDDDEDSVTSYYTENENYNTFDYYNSYEY